MSTFRMNSLAKISGRVALIAGLAVALGTGSAVACSLQNWSTTNGGIFASQPDGNGGDPAASPASTRYAGLCGSTAPGGVVSFVQDNRPGGIDRIIARFYVLNTGASNAVVYRGNNTGGTELFNVTLNGGNAIFNAGAASASAATQTGWNSIEIDWDSAGGTIGLIVNGGTAVTDNGVAAGALANVQLGNVNGAVGGDLSFDGYEAHLSTAVGRLLNADANDSGSITTADIVSIRNEILGVQLAPGTPDCNESGGVTTADIVCTRNIILNP